MTDLNDNKEGSGLAEVLRLSWPASLTMLNSTIIRFVDGVMVSRVGTASLSAQLLAGMWSFVPESFAAGMLTVVNTYVSQNFGARRYRRTSRYVWAGMLLAVVCAALVAPLGALARPIFSMFQHPGDPRAAGQILDLQVMYFRYMILAVGLTLAARPLAQFFFGIHRPGIVLASSIVSNLVNVLGNYVLIFGLWGFPRLELKGAAIGSIVAWGVQFAFLLSVFLGRRMHQRFATRAVRAARWRHCKELIRLGWPAGVQLCNDILCWSVFMSVLVSRAFGPVHLTASVVAMRYMGLSWMPAVGIGIATTAMVGKYIGEGRLELARRRTHAAVATAAAYMGACGLAFLLFRTPMVGFFVRVLPSPGLPADQARQLAGQIIGIGTNIMICAAVFQLFDAVGIVFVGALRGAGDTRWPMVVTLLLSWGLIVGGGSAVVRLLPQWTSIGPWIAAGAYIVCLGSLLCWRFESGAWRKIDLLGRRPPTPAAVEHAPVTPDVVLTADPADDQQ